MTVSLRKVTVDQKC